MKKNKSNRKRIWDAAKKQTIVQAVIRVLTEHGFERITMDRVAAEAGIAKGTLYLYFKDKDELLAAVLEFSLEPLVRKLDELIQSDLPPDRKIEYIAQRYLKYFEENRDFYRILLLERVRRSYHCHVAENIRYKDYLEAVAGIIQEGIAKNLFKPLDAVKVAAMLIESCVALLYHRMFWPGTTPVEEDARMLAQIFFHGMHREVSAA
ncbi:TetR/AcrR family transcriptional regulator [bacterium]|nr:TetR/AcrR family transcriptional regulator [candidate division CSSED10-310 bacterium]